MSYDMTLYYFLASSLADLRETTTAIERIDKISNRIPNTGI